MKNYLITSIKFSLSFSILGYLFYQAWQTEQFQTIAQTDTQWGWLVIAVLTCLGAHIISFVRWRLMVVALDLPFSYRDAIRIGFIGTFFQFIAFGVVGGDSLRAFYVTRQIKNRVPEAIASVVADRLVGMLTMFSFTSVAFLATDFSDMATIDPAKLTAMKWFCQFILVCTIIGYIGIGLLLFAPRVNKTRWFKKLTSMPRLGGLFKRMFAVVMMYRNRKRTLAICFVLSVMVNVCFATSIFAIAAGITNQHPTFANHFLIAPISMTANAVPLPGGLGGMEFALDFLYQAFSTETSESPGIAIAFAFRFSLLIVSAIGGVAWFINRKTLQSITDASKTETLDRV